MTKNHLTIASHLSSPSPKGGQTTTLDSTFNRLALTPTSVAQMSVAQNRATTDRNLELERRKEQVEELVLVTGHSFKEISELREIFGESHLSVLLPVKC